MAYYAALASLVQLLDDIVLHDRYPNLSLSKQAIIISLHKKFTSLEELLQGYSSKGDQVTDRVEGRIRDVAYQVQDIIELEISYQIDSEKGSPASKKTCHQSLSTGQSYAKKKLNVKRSKKYAEERSKKYAEDLHMVEQEIDLIAKELSMIKERLRNKGLLPNFFSAENDDFEKACIGRDITVGFDGYLSTIKEQLCGQSFHLQVIRIVGTSGIGKTTLARKIYGDALIKDRFDNYRAWVTVSQDYSEQKVFQDISKSLNMKKGEFCEGDSLEVQLFKYLKGRRYFFVIDDVWNTELWDVVRRIFPDDCKGSRILLTTQLEKVAQYPGCPGFLHQIQYLNKKASWKLFQEKVFGQVHCPPELETIGKSITRKCGGLPLAIVVLAGVLSDVKRTPDDWNKIESSVSEILSKSDERFSSILSLSYHHLSHQLKACFLYMGSFPEDYEIDTSNLVKLWVAEGFMKLANGTKSLEKAAEECLEHLVKRNLVIITKLRPNGQFKSCVVHDLLRGFCRQRAFHEYFFHDEHDEGYLCPRQGENIRCINFYCSLLDPPHPPHPCAAVKHVRLIRRYGKTRCSTFDIIRCDDIKLLRVLDVPQRKTWSFPDGMLQMFHLRYLGLQVPNLGPISPSICMLHNLQSLIIRVAGSLAVEFPPEIWKMTQLRHLIIIPMMTMPLTPFFGNGSVEKLVYLQTLMTLQDFRFTIEAIEMIPSLQKLKIQYDEDEPLDIWEMYCLYNLVRLPELEELKIKFCVYPNTPFGFPDTFAFPQNLTKLSLEGCQLPWKCVTVVGSLPNLRVLRLNQNSFMGEKWKPTEGEFLSLRFLLLENLDLKYWQAESSHFPRLEHLKIRECKELRKIPPETGDISTLKFIDVYGSKRAVNSAIKIREEQQDMENDMLHVRVGYW